MLYEAIHFWREVFTDGRSLPKDMSPTWTGYSIGRWEGDELVVETAGFNDRGWLDNGGHPNTSRLRVTERFRRIDFGHMELVMTIDDPGASAKPWMVKLPFTFQADNTCSSTCATRTIGTSRSSRRSERVGLSKDRWERFIESRARKNKSGLTTSDEISGSSGSRGWTIVPNEVD